MYIVVFNGPPESGKDTLAEMLQEHMCQQGVMVPTKLESLSLPLRSMAYAMVGMTYIPGIDDDPVQYAWFKNQYFDQLQRTGRQLLIDCSESFLVPTYGQAVMANLLLQRNQKFMSQPSVTMIRDSGFQREINPLIDAVGDENLYLVHVVRSGKSFDGDSREWVTHPVSSRFQIVHNNGSLDDLRAEAGRIYGRLVNQCGWKL